MRRVLHRLLFDTINSSIERRLTLDPIGTGKVSENLFAVRTETVNFYVYRSGEAILCFDTGYRRWLIREELRQLGIEPDMVTHVFLTHADIDHSQGLRVFKNAELYLSCREERMFKGIRSVRRAIRTPRILRPYRLLADGDTVRIGDVTVRAIETPGHTPGSMAYLLNDAYLFTGDTCKFCNGKAYVGRHYTMDAQRQEASLRKLAKLQNIRCVLSAHSGYTYDFDTAFEPWR
jgi:glyoxylase-like metal-dependent hydrolase (beta-lactamase superfamily II)